MASTTEITINVVVEDKNFQVCVHSDGTLRAFKRRIQGDAACAPDLQRLVHRGRLLADDLKTLDSYDIKDGNTIHVVKGRPAPPATAAPAPTPAAVPGGVAGMPGWGGGGADMASMQAQLQQNPEAMSAMLNSPMMRSITENPEVMRSMMESNPQLRALMDRNPQLRHALSDPATLRQTMQMMRNPAALQQMQRSQELAISQLENHPGGFQHLRRMYEEVQEPMMNASFGAQGDGQARGDGSAPVDNSGPVPNPWGAPAPAAPAPAAPASAPGQGMAGNPLLGNPMLANPMLANPMLANPMMGMPPMGGQEQQARAMSALQDPGMRAMMQQMLADPNTMQQMMSMNPMMRSMVDANPHMREMLRSPAFLDALSDPDTMQRLQQQMQGGPGSAFNPGFQGGFPPGPGGGSPGTPGLPAPPTSWGQAGPGSAGAVPPRVDAAAAYASQEAQLQGMGFTDRARNLAALEATHGNINAAVERLLSS